MFRVTLSDTVTPDNVKYMGEMIALRAFKPFLGFADRTFGNLYKGLIKDIHRSGEAEQPFSDGYDFAQTAICFLCEHIGKSLNDVLGTDRRGKAVTVKLACFRTVTRSMNQRLSSVSRNVCIDKVYEPRVSTPFEFEPDTSEEDLTAVNATIGQLKLTDKQKQALLCLMDVPSYAEAGRILALNKATVWVTVMRIREKYIRIFSQPKLRGSR